MVPHAGWFFCGALARAAIASLKSKARIVVLFGGHMPPGKRIQLFRSTRFETPLGPLSAYSDIHPKLAANFDIQDQDPYEPDNTTEVLLPFIAFFFPDAKLLILRPPPGDTARTLGEFLAEGLKETAVFIGSTDLTHYGPNYGFIPAGRGPAGIEWAQKNDSALLALIAAQKLKKATAHAMSERSACSVGAVIAAAAAAAKQGKTTFTEIGRCCSADIMPGDNTVGYSAAVWK